jgi:PAS domain S-box-containing protein
MTDPVRETSPREDASASDDGGATETPSSSELVVRPDERIAVLIVDDRPENLFALETVLEPLHLDVVRAGSGREALKNLLGREFAVILLDVLMPDMDGFATAELIRERAKTRHIPIIFLTAVSHQDEYVSRGYGLGAVDYMAKPFHPEILRAKVAVFVELFRANARLKQQAAQLQENERRERERALDEMRRLGETRYQRLAESMPQIVWTASPSGVATYANRRWFEYTGAPVGPLEADLWGSVLHLDDVPAVQVAWRNARASEAAFEIAARFRRADGIYRWHLIRAAPAVDARGALVEWIGTATDIDDRTRAEDGLRFLADATTALSESLEYRRTLSDVAALTARTIADWCVIDLLAHDRSPPWLCVAGSDPQRTEMARRFVSTGASHLSPMFHHEGTHEARLEMRETDPCDASPLSLPLIEPILVRGTPIGSLRLARWTSGRPFDALDGGLASDLARRIGLFIENARLYEVSQAERAALEAAARTKDEFLAVLSHELRSPLHTTLGWAQMLRTGNLEPQTFEVALETIERSARAQVRLVDDLLDVSSIVTGKLRLKVGPVDLVEVVRASVEAVQPACVAKAIDLQLELPAEGAPMRGDPARLQQVVWNLLSNAIKFTPKNGHIRVSLERADDLVRLAVADDGAGIESEFLPFVFDRFRQANSSATRSYGGLGLGLSIVRNLVELHGGRCWADSPGLRQGTTVTIELPIAPTAVRAALAVEGETPAPMLEGTRVMVVDDLAESRALFQIALERAGAQVRVAASVAEAVEQMAASRPDVLVSDIGLPGESGYDLIRRVRQSDDPAMREMPAIALTAYASESDRRACLEAGFNMHLAKPIDHEQLIAALREVLAPARAA